MAIEYDFGGSDSLVPSPTRARGWSAKAQPAPDVPTNAVFAGGCSHAADLLLRPEVGPPDAATRVGQAYARLARDIAAAAPDLMVVITDCHFQRFPTGAFVVGTGERHAGSMAAFDRPDQKLALAGDPSYAYAIADCVRAEGLEVAESTRVELDNELIGSLQQLLPRPDLPVVPIITQPARAFSPFGARLFGQVLRHVVESRERRVAILATGGLSHLPDPGKAGRIDVEFDLSVLDMMKSGRALELGDLTPYTLLRCGQHEILNWLVMLGIVGPAIPGEVYAYEPMSASGGWVVVNMRLPSGRPETVGGPATSAS